MDVPSAEDLALMRDETVGNVGFDVTDEQLRQVWRDDTHLVALAREWTWGDTEARDQLCARLETLGPRQLAPGQSATVGLRVAVVTYPHRRAEPRDRSATAFVGQLTSLVEDTIVCSDAVRAAGGAVVVSLADQPTELPPFADAAVTLRLDLTVTESGWPARTGSSSTLSEQVRAYVADGLGAVEQVAGAGITVDVVSLVHGSHR